MTAKTVVYLADDDRNGGPADDRFFVRQSFQKINPSVRIVDAEEGEALLALLGSWTQQTAPSPVHLILQDINMPRMNGLETLRAIKANPRLRHIPAVILSTCTEATSVAEAYRSGGNGYIQKSSSGTSTDQIIQAVNLCFLDAVMD